MSWPEHTSQVSSQNHDRKGQYHPNICALALHLRHGHPPAKARDQVRGQARVGRVLPFISRFPATISWCMALIGFEDQSSIDSISFFIILPGTEKDLALLKTKALLK